MSPDAAPPLVLRAGVPADAEAVAGLIASFQRELTDEPSGAGAERYLASVSVSAERECLASPRYRYLLAFADVQFAGFIAIRDGTHVFHLFVRRDLHRGGVARRLWQQALRELCVRGPEPVLTVNSSLGAVPVYAAFGFAPTGGTQRAHGISFVPMQRPFRADEA